MKSALAKSWGQGLPASVLTVLRNSRADRPVPPAAAAPHARALRVASYNIHKCVGQDRRFDPDRIMRVIAELDADIVALQEADRRFGDRAGLLDLGRLRAMTGLVPVPVRGLRKAQGWHGNLLLHRQGLLQEARQIALPGLEPRGAILGDFCLGETGRVRVIAAHFGLLRQSRTVQARVLHDLMRGEDRPALLMGDLNEWRIDHRAAVNRLGDPGAGLLVPAAPSFPAGRPILPLDRIIASPGATLSDMRAHDSALARIASDHLPVTALLELPRG